MRSWVVALLSVATLVGTYAAGCGSDDGGGGGSGGSGGTGAEGGSTTTVPGNCTAITIDPFKLLDGAEGESAIYGGATVPGIGAAAEDAGQLELLDAALTGTIDLGAPEQSNYGTCTACLLVAEDFDDTGAPTRLYFQQSGTLDLGATTLFYIAGSLSSVTLVEVTVDPDTYESTPVPNGRCLTIESMPFAIEAPPGGWTCEPMFYDAGASDACDCECGIVDPDCSLPDIGVFGCYEGQTCNAQAHCEGTPTAWTCDAANFNAADGCHCGCGMGDPDCDLDGAEVIGCDADQICGDGVCMPAAWTCDGFFYGDGSDCDCACGAPDPDCTIPDAPVYGCEDTEQFTGVCLADGTCEPV